MSIDADPWTWLEDVEGEQAMAWVTQRSAQAESALHTERFQTISTDIRDALEASDRIPLVSQAGDHLYGFWTDAEHPRGIWRRTSWESYRSEEPDWEVLLDVDALCEAEGEPWVWQGAQLLRPGLDRALVHLSRGGSDAGTTRELDLRTGDFIPAPEGFVKSEAKGRLVWRDADHVYLFSAADATGATRSGYPRTVRLWRRGTPIEEAPVVHSLPEDDMGLFAYHDQRSGRTELVRALAFYRDELLLADGQGWTALPVPESADASISPNGEYVALRLRHSWRPEHGREHGREHGHASEQVEYAAGSLVVAPLAEVRSGQAEWTPVFTPDERSALVDLTWTAHHLVTTVLVDVRHTVHLHTPDADGSWTSRDLTGGLDVGLRTVSVAAVDGHESDDLWLVTTGYLEPMALSVARIGEQVEVELLKSAPARFDATGVQVTQHWATSADGTGVPYWQVGPAELDGPVPTVLHGYGGFEQPLTPAYDPIVGRSWLAYGRVHVVAGIRGGGEFGPRWHQAALGPERHRAYEDFVAVARDLVARGVTTVPQLGCTGRSNGGLLVGNMITGYPEDFGAVVCQVPLLDMQRYHLLLAGASWMAEDGDPDDPEAWEWLQTYSPYHRFDPSRPTPAVYLATSTRDDRVHPGHARKMAALLGEHDRDVTYWENTEGGHGGASTPEQWATWHALAWEFLHQRLG